MAFVRPLYSVGIARGAAVAGAAASPHVASIGNQTFYLPPLSGSTAERMLLRWSEMRKLVVLLTTVALASSMMMVLGGCGLAAPADQPAAAPTETAAPLQKPTATVATPLVEDSVSAPTPSSRGGRADWRRGD